MTSSALGSFEAAARLPGGDAAAARYLCQLYNQSGDTKKAEAYCIKAAAADSSSAEIYYNLGFAQSRLGKGKAARDSFEKAVAADGSYAPALYNLGYMDNEAGDLDAALKHFQAGPRCQGRRLPRGPVQLGRGPRRAGQVGPRPPASTRKCWPRTPATRTPRPTWPMWPRPAARRSWTRAATAYENGNFEEASRAWNDALALDPGNEAAKGFLEKVKSKSTAKQDSALAAKKAAKKAVASRLKSEDEKVLKEGLAAAKAGKLAQAVRLLGFYVRKNPANHQASQAFFEAKGELGRQVDDLLQRAGRSLVDEDKAGAKALVTKRPWPWTRATAVPTRCWPRSPGSRAARSPRVTR